MCGFAGEFLLGPGRANLNVASAMAGRLIHRGPDEEGSYLSPDGRCAIGFRRLSIVDPPLSHQPMASLDGEAVVAFNGEIYNFRDLRTGLQQAGVSLATQGDTEVLPALYQSRGEKMLTELEGMFAFALYDRRAGKLMLARDRLGEKPLWYAMLPDRVLFASEAKALLAHPLLEPQIDPQAVAFYLSLGYVPSPRSIWKNIHKLPPAHYLLIDSKVSQPEQYWQMPLTTAKIPHAEALERTRALLRQSVARRMVADVPLGAMLSGGVDSSITVALMVEAAGKAGGIKTFSAGFEQQGFDERPYARRVAEHLGTEHTELLVSASDAPGLLEDLVRQYDEPFGDSSALALYLICQAARQHVSVALTGDGGDEVFGGYDRYRAMQFTSRMGGIGWATMKVVAALTKLAAPQDERSAARRLVRLSDGLDDVPAMQYFLYRRLFGPGQMAALLERDFAQAATIDQPEQWFAELYEQGEYDDEFAFAQHHDLASYLPDDLLVKSDIASMAHSLELRTPMLDSSLVALGLSMPVNLKAGTLRGKKILHQAFASLLPPEVFRRPKRGFAIPIDSWLCGDLSALLHETLLEGPLVGHSWFARTALEQLINEHQSRQADHRHRLWALLCLGRWLAM
jgi:asparagine synthase (glutamine-hydrolysing)